MNLLDLVFQSGDFYNQGSAADWISFGTGLIGAFIGSATAFTVYYFRSKSDKEKENRIRTENETNTLKYFSALVESSLHFAKKQAEGYKEHALNLKTQPLFPHQMHRAISADLSRVVKRAEHEKIFLAYVNKFGNDKKRVKTFQQIFGRLDYFNEINEQAIVSQEKHITELTERMLRYKDLGDEEILNFCALYCYRIEQTNPTALKDPFYLALLSAINKYYKNAPEHKTVEYLQDGFINPLKDELNKNFRHVDTAREIADKCRKATWLFNETRRKSELASDDFQAFHDNVIEVTNQLEKLVGDLLKDYGSEEIIQPKE